MKIKKFTPAEVADGTLTLKDYLKNFGSTVPSGMASDTAPTEYFARLNYAYPDAPKRKVPLLIVGEMTATWSKLCKSELKDNKKFVSYGTCQLAKDDAGADIIELQPTKGSGKLRMLEALFNKVAAKTGIAIRVKPGTGEAAEGNTLTADDEKELAAASVASDDDLTDAPKQHPLEAAYPNLETMRKQVDAIIDKLDVNAATIPISAANLATIQSYMKNMNNWLAMWQSGDEAAKKAFETTYKGWAKARFDGYVWLKNNLLPKCKASANNPDEQHIKSLANEIIQLYKQLTQA